MSVKSRGGFSKNGRHACYCINPFRFSVGPAVPYIEVGSCIIFGVGDDRLSTHPKSFIDGDLSERIGNHQERISHAEANVEWVEETQGTPPFSEYRGEMVIDGEVVKFLTDIDKIETGTHHIVYEWTETLVGETVIEVHDIIQ